MKLKLNIRENKSLQASIIGILCALLINYLAFTVILPIDSDVLQIVVFILIFLAVKMAVAKRLGVDNSVYDKDYAELDERLKTPNKKK